MFENYRFLFLDRDGVINRRLPGAYVRRWEEFEFLPGVPAAVARLSARFDRIFVITNQQGVGKGVMTEAEVEEVHARMREAIETAGGRLDGIYCCPHLAADQCPCRKPRPGLALQARADFPEVRFDRSLLAGDSLSDLQLGDQLGMANIWVDTKKDDRAAIEAAFAAGELRVDKRVAGLPELADLLPGRSE